MGYSASSYIGPCAVYRHFDADGSLLYIGVSSDPHSRHMGHLSRGSEWATQVATIKVEWHEDRAAALLAESDAIAAERPKHNRLGNPDVPRPKQRRLAGPLLAEWLAQHDEKPSAFAKRAGICPKQLRLVLTCRSSVHYSTAAKIEEATGGDLVRFVWDPRPFPPGGWTIKERAATRALLLRLDQLNSGLEVAA